MICPPGKSMSFHKKETEKIELVARPETNEKVRKKKKEKWSEERKMEAKLKRENSEAQPANNPPKKRAKKHERKREKLSKKKKSDPNHVHQSGTYVRNYFSLFFI